MAATKPVIGFVGLGDQGAPIAQRIIDAGYPMVIWARREATLEPFRDTPAEVADDLHDLGERVDIACLCVLDDDDVVDVIDRGLLEGLRPGSLIVVNSTTKPETCQQLAARAQERDVHLVDAPVSGMAHGAREGTMAIFVGGSDEDFARYEPVARTFGTPIHMGAVGTGQITKLLNNMTAVCNLTIAQDTLAISAELGIARDAMFNAMMVGSSASRMLGTYQRFDFDPILKRPPDFFLRDWSRILSDLRHVLANANVDGRLIDELGEVFIQRTKAHVGAT